jgi:hypothetical protein
VEEIVTVLGHARDSGPSARLSSAAAAVSSLARGRGSEAMHMTLYTPALIPLIAGILILIVPRLLNYIVALYLIIIGVVGLFH